MASSLSVTVWSLCWQWKGWYNLVDLHIAFVAHNFILIIIATHNNKLTTNHMSLASGIPPTKCCLIKKNMPQTDLFLTANMLRKAYITWRQWSRIYYGASSLAQRFWFIKVSSLNICPFTLDLIRVNEKVVSLGPSGSRYSWLTTPAGYYLIIRSLASTFSWRIRLSGELYRGGVVPRIGYHWFEHLPWRNLSSSIMPVHRGRNKLGCETAHKGPAPSSVLILA